MPREAQRESRNVVSFALKVAIDSQASRRVQAINQGVGAVGLGLSLFGALSSRDAGHSG